MFRTVFSSINKSMNKVHFVVFVVVVVHWGIATHRSLASIYLICRNISCARIVRVCVIPAFGIARSHVLFSSRRILSSMRGKGATLATGANQVGSAPSNGAAAVTRRAIPGAPDPARAHGFCFGFGADGEGLAERLKQLFAGEDGYGNGPITEGGCNTPNFSEAGVTKGKGLWQEDEKGYLIQGVHNGNATEGHPRCQIGGTVPVEKVNGSWRLCKWALPYVTTGKIVSRITHDQRFNGAFKKCRNNKRPQNCVPTV